MKIFSWEQWKLYGRVVWAQVWAWVHLIALFAYVTSHIGGWRSFFIGAALGASTWLVVKDTIERLERVLLKP